jgi:hypothetical protein
LQRLQLIAAVIWIAVGTSLAARAELKPTTLDKPIFVQVTMRDGGEKLAGSLIRFDDDALVVKTGAGERELKWDQLTGASGFTVRAQLIDRKTAAAWLELAEWAMKRDLGEQAKQAVNQALRIDPRSRLKGDAILRGQGAAKPATQSNTAASPGTSGSSGVTKDADVVRYQKPTPQQDAAAMLRYRKASSEIQAKLGVQLNEFETPHFLVFTNWPADQHGFLKENLEGAYAAVSKQFGIPASENVFVGKLPVYMLEKEMDFYRFAVADGGPANAAGYYRGWSDGSGHMVMSKPDVKKWGPQQAERAWARILTHEFTHAFVARYRTNRFVPRWLNEGTAEVIALGQFPDPAAYGRAQAMANSNFDFLSVFAKQEGLSAELYPVWFTIVEALAKDNNKAFVAMFNDIKDGMEPQEALKKHFKVEYKDMREGWERYLHEMSRPQGRGAN